MRWARLPWPPGWAWDAVTNRQVAASANAMRVTVMAVSSPRMAPSFDDSGGGVTGACRASRAIAWSGMVRPIRHILGLGGILAFAAVLLPAGPWPAAAQISTVGTSGVGPFTQEQ